MEKDVAPEGSITLRFSRIGTLVVCGFYFLVVALAVFLDVQLVARELGFEPSSTVRNAGRLAMLATSFVLPGFLIWLRQPKGARVEWDGWGITEWDGDGVRTAISWEEARLSVERYSWRASNSDGSHLGMAHAEILLQLVGHRGRRIMVGTLLREGHLCRRRAEAKSREPVEALLRAAESRELGKPLPPAAWNELSSHRPGKRGLLTTGAAWLGYPLFVIGSGLATAATPLPNAVPLVAAGAFFLVLRMVRPARELLGLVREGRALKPGRAVELVDNVGSVVRGLDLSGKAMELETDELGHPDARLAERRGTAIVVSAEGGVAAASYREAAAHARPERIEMTGAIQARRALTHAVLAELFLRAAFPVLAGLVVLAVLGVF